MDKDAALSKIKKCLALAKSANPHEAAAAMRQAQALMKAHNLSEVDISLADVKEHPTKAPSNRISMWQSRLARSVAEAFGCDLFYSLVQLGWLARTKRTDVVFLGIGAAPEVAAYAFNVLLRQCMKDRQAHIAAQSRKLKQRTKTARGDAFAMAWVYAVRSQLETFAGNAGTPELLVAYMQKHHPDLGEFKPASRHLSRYVNDESAASGYQAGARARLDRAINGGTTTPALPR
jgi:hypothetical protein